MKSIGHYRFILGSSSPRRHDLLQQIGVKFKVIKPQFDEKRLPGEDPVAYALRNSTSKGLWVAQDLIRQEGAAMVDTFILSADTIVVLNGDVLEKPLDEQNAIDMLSRLSGNTHTVITGMSLTLIDRSQQVTERSRIVKSQVTIKPMVREEIVAYVRTGEPMDKAGSYAIQGKGAYMVSRIDGSYTNVVGLPLSDFVDLLENEFGVWLFKDH